MIPLLLQKKKKKETCPQKSTRKFSQPPTCFQPRGKILSAALFSEPAWPAEEPDVVYLCFCWAVSRRILVALGMAARSPEP